MRYFIIARTSGDGMEYHEESKKLTENVSLVKQHYVEPSYTKSYAKEQIRQKSTITQIPGLHSIYRPPDTRVIPPEIPKGKLYLLKPKVILKPANAEKKKSRPPRFIPFEPYTAAVTFITQPKKLFTRIKKKTRNNLDINILVSQMSNMKSSELDSASNTTASAGSETSKEIQKITEERDYFQSQLKFQAQVNSELKCLLVAAVGEDLQTKVNVLTEDKLQLARALLDSANNLSTHTEQIEFLAGQCEVWRSKFLASSVMIEELARWKADLTHKNSMLTNSNRHMLQLTMKIREMELELLKNLKFLANLKNLNLRSTDIYNLTAECLNITQQMVLHSGFGMPNDLDLSSTNALTETEHMAIKVFAWK